MKTTVEIPDALLREARKVATRQDTTLRALIVDGLRRIVDERKSPSGFVLRDVSFGGQGLQPELDEAGWDRIRELTYQGRGG